MSVGDKKIGKIEVSAKLLAATLFELNPSRSIEDWEKHIIECEGNPKKFFGGNGEGLAEYEAFCRTFDADTHAKRRNRRQSGR